MSKETFDIGQIAQGHLGEKIKKEWQKLLANMQDPNTAYKPARKLTITLTCTQNEQRDMMQVLGQVTSKLAPDTSILTTFATGEDTKTGKAYAREFGALDARQISFDGLDKTSEGYLVDQEGEVVNYDSKTVSLEQAR